MMAADATIRQNKRVGASVLAWRSTRLKRAISSTVAAETFSLSAALAGAQSLQVIVTVVNRRDAVCHYFSVPNWQVASSPFTAVISPQCHFAEASGTVSAVDAKSVLDTCQNTSGPKADRRNAI